MPDLEALQPYAATPAGRGRFLRLDANENTRGPSPQVLARLRGIGSEDVSVYPDDSELRQALAAYFHLDAIAPDLDLLLTCGLDEGIRLACDGFVTRGDRVVIPEPSFAMYGICARLAGGTIVEVPYEPDFSFPSEALRDAVTRAARLVFLPDPNNPTGTPVPSGFLEELSTAAPETVFFVDEAYAEYSGRTSLPLLDRAPNLIVGRTFSKAWGLAGLRAGVLIGRRDIIGWLARARAPYPVGSPTIVGLLAALEDSGWPVRCAEEARDCIGLMVRGLGSLGVPVHAGPANFLLARFGPDAAAVASGFERRGILVRKLDAHPLLEGSLRISCGTHEETRVFLRAAEEVLEELRTQRSRRG